MKLLHLFRHLINTPKLVWAAVLTIWVACSWTYALLESKGPIEGLWWGIVTGSTVGYGDFYPESTPGRLIGAILICAMLLLIPIGIGDVIAGLVHDRNEFTHEEQIALDERTKHACELAEENNMLLRALLARQYGHYLLRHILQTNGFPENREYQVYVPPTVIETEKETHA
jgi:hypothetical protein